MRNRNKEFAKQIFYNIFQILLRNTLGIEKMEIIVSDIICDVNDLSRIFQGHSWGRMAGGGSSYPPEILQSDYKALINVISAVPRNKIKVLEFCFVKSALPPAQNILVTALVFQTRI